MMEEMPEEARSNCAVFGEECKRLISRISVIEAPEGRQCAPDSVTKVLHVANLRECSPLAFRVGCGR